ncbi:protein kinase domain-containing protein [Azohydromonas sediminis]|uniref:protein kinase domain-containing protein n=1 Tax=Azohydromonas sediminis TaxID=2259674 RepID=UPI000E6526BF|nr:serine/threonine protein kinase [Azohydromonas sediminis]
MSAVLPAARSPGRTVLGRFVLERKLGEGAQASVWLGRDTRLEREVALKLLAPDADAGAVSQWLHEARAVSQLTHPHIVPVFEADEHDGQSYLVFEYVAGPTLSQRLRSGGAIAPREAVTMMLGVLDALRAAHARGIVHRDLKPSNILLDADGRARVMDFGIAARIADPHDRRIFGTPGYMSPEAARGKPPTPAMDVFGAGVVLAEMLSGTPLLRERDPMRAIERVALEQLELPEHLGDPPDDALRAIVRRAIARDAAQRFADVGEMHRALAQWLQPKVEAVVDPEASGTLEFLLRRMRLKSDFPALSDSVARIQRLTRSENENLNNLASEILQDVALTNKLLRMVNSAHYFAAGPVTTVSRAVALVGFAGVRNMALALVLLEHMHDKGHAQQLKEEFLRALMAGTLAGELVPAVRDGEEAFLSAMFQNLGRLLTEFYLREEAQQIRALMRPPEGTLEAAAPPDQDSAAVRVLGISFEDLGLGVAKSWGLPETLRQSMRRAGPDTPARAAERGPERMRWLGQAANEVADALLYSDDADAKIGDIEQRYARVLGFKPDELKRAAEQAQQRLASLVEAMAIRVGPTDRAQRLLAPPAAAAEDSLSPLQLQAAAAAAAPAALDLDLGEPAADVLAAGIQDITNHMVSDGFRLNEVLRMVLETMLRALRVRRVVFALRDAKTNTLVGRFGLGDGADAVSAALRVPLQLAPGAAADLFTAVCLKGVDTLIADANVANIAARLPPWFRERVGAPSFLLLPLTLKNAPLGLIYADQATAGGIALGEKELSLLRTLRNQAVMAFRQAGG